jgi:hypothetical protein
VAAAHIFFVSGVRPVLVTFVRPSRPPRPLRPFRPRFMDSAIHILSASTAMALWIVLSIKSKGPTLYNLQTSASPKEEVVANCDHLNLSTSAQALHFKHFRVLDPLTEPPTLPQRLSCRDSLPSARQDHIRPIGPIRPGNSPSVSCLLSSEFSPLRGFEFLPLRQPLFLPKIDGWAPCSKTQRARHGC